MPQSLFYFGQFLMFWMLEIGVRHASIQANPNDSVRMTNPKRMYCPGNEEVLQPMREKPANHGGVIPSVSHYNYLNLRQQDSSFFLFFSRTLTNINFFYP